MKPIGYKTSFCTSSTAGTHSFDADFFFSGGSAARAGYGALTRADADSLTARGRAQTELGPGREDGTVRRLTRFRLARVAVAPVQSHVPVHASSGAGVGGRTAGGAALGPQAPLGELWAGLEM